MHLHILGIGGTFMGGLALIARSAGHRVTGCDQAVYPPMSTQLAEQGIDFIEGFDASQLDLNPDVFVIGNVVSRGNALMEAILNASARYVSGPQWLGENILTSQHVLSVAGTHGKTTTSSMLAWILQQAGMEPNFLIGGIAPGLGVSARFDASKNLFVIEADEYDTAFFDKRSKFVHYRTRTAILNNLEYDHADIFPDLSAIETQFHHLVRTVPSLGAVIVNDGEPALDRVLARGCWSPVTRIGQADGWHSQTIDGQTVIYQGAQPIGSLTWSLTGEHNTKNALAAMAGAHGVGVAATDALAALNQFGGVKRRMEVRGVVNGVTVYDDFAHHPTAIETTLTGLRQRVDKARILAVLEPRSNTMKLGAMAARLPQSLQQADQTFCYAGGQGKQALGWDPAQVMAALGDTLTVDHDLDMLVAHVVAKAQPGDHVVIMSNGGFGGVHDKLLAALGQSS
jgi:UDP-N-acetylmuramate: L-alanyl-gamma-D-glutamyl-meso-diaminopimelate ligase